MTTEAEELDREDTEMRYRIPQRKLNAEQLAEALSKPLMVAMKAGALRNGNELGHGKVFHLVPREWKDGGPALCGTVPSIMWSERWRNDQCETCPKCIKLQAEWLEAGFVEANNEAHLARLP